jgi:ferredoxin-NADP reductase
MLTCCRVVDETHDIEAFEFRTEGALPVRFEPEPPAIQLAQS